MWGPELLLLRYKYKDTSTKYYEDVVSTRLPAVNTNTNTDQYEDTNHDK